MQSYIHDPAEITHVEITGNDLNLREVIAVSRHGATVSISSNARTRINRSRSAVEDLVRSREKVYGLNTGFGSLRDVVIPPEDVEQLQLNLIRSHAAGVGDPLPEDAVRAMMLLRLNALCAGYSGIRLTTLQRIVTLLNHRVYPWVPRRGSVGASGDLAPLAHLALVITGDASGRIYFRENDTSPKHRGDYIDSPRANGFQPLHQGVLHQVCGLSTYKLKAKEGLALTNGTQLMTAMGALCLYDAFVAFEAAILAASAGLEAIKGSLQAFDDRISKLRNMDQQVRVAGWIRSLLHESDILLSPYNVPYINRIRRRIETILGESIPERIRETLVSVVDQCDHVIEKTERGEHPRLETRDIFRIVSEAIVSLDAAGFDRLRSNLAPILSEIESVAPSSPRVQDDYSFRCIPQVLGSALWALEFCVDRIEAEMNAVTDNPLIFPGLEEHPVTPEVLSGGNFHGEPVAMALDIAGIAAAEIASLSERKSAQLLDSSHHYGLPSQLIARSGVNSGFMIAQYTAAALTSENKLLAHPASVDSIPTCENTEDHVSMGPVAAMKLRQIVENLEDVVGIELLLAGQALHMWQPLRPGPGGRLLHKLLSGMEVPFVENDMPLYELMERTVHLIRNGSIRREIDALLRTSSAGEEETA